MKYHLALDATAVAAYAAGSIHVGEVLAEAADDTAGHVAVPVAALLRAHVEGADPGRLDLLCRLPHVEVLPVDVDGWRRTAAATKLLIGLDRACAALLVVDGQAGFVVTADQDGYGGIETIQI